MSNKDVSSLYNSGRTVFSVEFFPPKREESLETVKNKISLFADLPVDYMTVTYGAGGSTKSFTLELLTFISTVLKKRVVSHLTCLGNSQADIDLVLGKLTELGIQNVLALRGDVPKDQLEKQGSATSSFNCARDLIKYINSKYDFTILAAGYPETHRDAASPADDITYLKEKVDSGASVILTQLFFDADIYLRFVDKCRSAGINVPIVPGIMPIRDYSQLTRFTSMCGASIPDDIKKDLEKIQHDPKSVIEYGTNQGMKLTEKLISEGAPGVHFYSLNHNSQVREIISNFSESLVVKRFA